MIIINADDWGCSDAVTDAALSCYRAGRITSVTAMVFMQDSGRAADLAKEIDINVGLHVNLSERFTGDCRDKLLREYHDRIVHFLTFSKYAVLLYNPALKNQFDYVYRAQVEEFLRLYGKPPSHIDGHHHKHLCANMLLDRVIPCGEKVRRNLSFRPGEKSLLNRTYRNLVDLWLARSYKSTDYLFSLSQCLESGSLTRYTNLANKANVEIMVHPTRPKEYASLMSEEYLAMLHKHKTGTFSSL